MAPSPNRYRRLPGTGKNWIEYSRLYQGADHLLQVISSGYSERYKRFYFRDIQAISIVASNQRRVWNWVLGLPLLLFGIIWSSWMVSFPPVTSGAIIGGLIVGSLFGVPLLVNNFLGPACVTRVQTAVQNERLWPLSRVRRAQKVLAGIRPLIEAAQGPLGRSDVSREAPVGEEPAPRRVASRPRVVSAPALAASPYIGNAHTILFGLLLADLPITLMDLTANSAWSQIPGTALFGGTVIVAVMALVKQRGTDLPLGLRRLPWLAVGLMGSVFIIAGGYGAIIAMQQGPDALAHLSFRRDGFTAGLSLVSGFLSLGLGILGFIQLRRHRRAGSVPSPLRVAAPVAAPVAYAPPPNPPGGPQAGQD